MACRTIADNQENTSTLAIAAVAVTDCSTQTNQNSTSKATKQSAISTPPAVSPFISSVTRPAQPIESPKSKYAEGWGLSAIQDFQGKRSARPGQSIVGVTETDNTTEATESNASISKSTTRPRTASEFFRCSADCDVCASIDSSPDGKRYDDASPNNSDESNTDSLEERHSTSSSSSSSLSTLLSSATSASSTTSQPSFTRLMPIDTSNPYIAAEKLAQSAERAGFLSLQRSLGLHAVGMLRGYGRGKRDWEDGVGVMEDDVLDDQGEKRGMGVLEHRSWLGRRGFRLEGTVQPSWRTGRRRPS